MCDAPLCPTCSGKGFVPRLFFFKKVCRACNASGRIRPHATAMPEDIAAVANVLSLDAYRTTRSGPQGKGPPKAA
jgi:hypothetical protein